MKCKLVLIASIFTMSFLFFGCKSETANSDISASASNTVPTHCILHDHREGRIIQKMNASCAKSLIENYQVKVEEIKTQCSTYPNINDLLIYGSQVKLDEMRKIINIIDSLSITPPDSLYIMLAAHNTGKSGMIFAFEHNENNNPDPYSYYNFTRPCPDACPTL